jgi:hypothetical protein
MHCSLLLPPPWSPAGRALADLRRLVGYLVAVVLVALAQLLTWTGYGIGAAAAVVALLVALVIAAVFLGVCAGLAVAVWGIFAFAAKTRVSARILAAWAQR